MPPLKAKVAAKATEHFQALDGLRGIFALMVAMVHLSMLSHFYDLPFIRNAGLVVNFFFILSGFVITHSAYNKLNSPQDGAIFALRRLGRVWPLHLIMLALFVGLEGTKLLVLLKTGLMPAVPPFAADSAYPLWGIPAHILLIHSLNLFDTFTFNGPSWSISTEFYTYLLFALCVITCKRYFPIAALTLIAICALWLSVLPPEFIHAYKTGMISCVYAFFMGSCVYLAYQKFSRFRLPNTIWANMAETASVLLFLYILCFTRNLSDVLSPLAFAAMLWVFAQQKGWVSNVLQISPLQKLGLWSYGIYMIHMFINLMINRSVRFLDHFTNQPVMVEYFSKLDGKTVKLIHIGNAWVMDAATLVYLAAVILAAALSYRFIERPGQRFFNTLATKWFGAKPKRTPESPAP